MDMLVAAQMRRSRHRPTKREKLKTMGAQDDVHTYWEYESRTERDRKEHEKLSAIGKEGTLT